MFFFAVHPFSSTDCSRPTIVSCVCVCGELCWLEERRLKAWSDLINGLFTGSTWDFKSQTCGKIKELFFVYEYEQVS